MCDRKIELVKSLLFEGAAATLPVYGNSMRPLFRHDQVVTVLPLPGTRLKRGMCCVYFHQNHLIMHRLIHHSKKDTFFIGDNTWWIDKVAPDKIVGYVPVQNHPVNDMLIIAINFIFYPFRNSVLFTMRNYSIKLLWKVSSLCESPTKNRSCILNN